MYLYCINIGGAAIENGYFEIVNGAFTDRKEGGFTYTY